jgi:hypothetical protein
MLKQLLFVALALASTNLYAQKMNVLDYFKAFISNSKSPNSDLAYFNVQLLNENQKNYAHYGRSLNEKHELTTNNNKTYLTYKDFIGWNGGKCYPTFKVYTKANGQQVLGVTEDAYTHNSYKSKYRLPGPTLDYSDCPNYDADKNAIRRNRELTSEERAQKNAELDKKVNKYLRENDPFHLWNQRPKPIKFWTYEGGNWTEVTDEVMSEFFTLEQLISKTTATPDAGLSLTEHIKQNIAHHIYPLYRIEADKDEITVWVDEARLRLFTTEVEEFANPADNIASRKVGLTKNIFNFTETTNFKSYTLVWDAKAGQFVRKK